jgi:tRNA 5-methylaminomethyl-2-thiouridine biosynthesis bifunctional protein
MMSSDTYDVLVVGGGLAGTSTAYALAQRALKVLLCESEPRLASKASGNAWALLMPYVATQSSPPGRLYAEGFNFTHNLLTSTFEGLVSYHEVGAIQLPATKRLSRILTETVPFVGNSPIRRVSAQEGSDLAGVTLLTASFFIPQAGYCKPARIAEHLATSFPSHISISLGRSLEDLRWIDSKWSALFNDGSANSFTNVVLCGAHDIQRLPLTSWVPLEAIRGQTTQTVTTPSSSRLRTVVSYDGYITPQQEGLHFIGAHYRHDDFDTEPKDLDTQEILARLYRTLPDISDLKVASSRVCFRASTHDRMPYIGALPNNDGPHLFINAGHGSRGLLTAPLGGEIIARLIDGQPLDNLSEAAGICSSGRLLTRLPRLPPPS